MIPKINTPEYTCILPSTKQKIKYRPYLVKEEKLLMMAQESIDPEQMVSALKQVLESCILSEDIDVEKLPSFDLDYLFLQLRIKSVGEKSVLKFTINDCDKKCTQETSVDLTKIKVKFDETHTKVIKLTKDSGVKMRYPTIDLMAALTNKSEDKNPITIIMGVIVKCIDSIYIGDDVYDHKEHSVEDFDEWINNLNKEQFEKIAAFFETMPKIKTKVKFECKDCGRKFDYPIEGIDNFFA